jgi:hypothetical protein
VEGQWYLLENYGGNHSFKGEYKGIGYGTSSVFVCKYGSINPIATERIKPVDRLSHWYVSGPIPKDEITEADRQAKRDQDAKYAAYVAALPAWQR